MRSVGVGRGLSTLVVAWLTGCAYPPPPVASPPPPPHRSRLAVLPTESEQFPTVAAEANAALRAVRIAGVEELFQSSVSLEVVQLSIECVDPTDACYSAVGKALAADRLLLAQIAPDLRHSNSGRRASGCRCASGGDGGSGDGGSGDGGSGDGGSGDGGSGDSGSGDRGSAAHRGPVCRTGRGSRGGCSSSCSRDGHRS
jgi:hypothetical protein